MTPRPRGTTLSIRLAFTHHTEPIDFLQRHLIEPVVVPALIVGRAHERVVDDVPTQHHTSLIWVIRMRALRQSAATHVVRHEESLGCVWLPSKRFTEEQVIGLD